jgi:hypothetical protein
MSVDPNAVLEMSDEDFLKLPESGFDAPEEAPAADDEAPAGGVVDEAEVLNDLEDAGDVNEEDDDDDDDLEIEKAPVQDSSGTSVADPVAGAKPGTDDKPKADTVVPEPAAEAIDYKAAYEKITGTFKANGRDMKVNNVDDVVRLMQQGANYNHKMQGLKPSLRILKTLEKADISEDKLNYLIDLDKKDPTAIARLVKESGINPLDIDLEQSEKYTAANHAANDTEMALDGVIGEIRESPHYPATLSLVATKWDAASKQAVVDSPQLLKTIHDHMASGVYDLISTELEQERMFGRVSGMSDVQAYKHVGDMIDARGGFAHLFSPGQSSQVPAPVIPDPIKAADELARKDKKRAASSPKAALTSVAKEYNPLAMSDEEFEKQFDSTLK